MKKIYCFLFFCLGSCSVFSQSKITFSFMGKDAVSQNLLVLDSVHVLNLTLSCDTILYNPVTSLVIPVWNVGLQDLNSKTKGEFILYPNYPNPFVGSTHVSVYREYSGPLNLILYDAYGRKLASCQNNLDKGFHSFQISSSGNKVLILNVSDRKNSRIIKIIGDGHGQSQNSIQYIGQIPIAEKGHFKSSESTEFNFYVGSQLTYTAYVTGYTKNTLHDYPTGDSTYSFTMSKSAFSCGTSITINHSAGNTAPVSKTVTYGTVTNIPGEPSKCWITSNLGADHQAKAAEDATEASAGWYWQFNRKQGYKHDGATRTPNTTWISFINESSEWTDSNDPCSYELGNGWRIPTSTEWTNVDESGNWASSTDTWNSGLKLHAAGFVGNGNGSLSYCGSYGDYWSSSQASAYNGSELSFYSGYSNMRNTSQKTNAYPLRCIRNAGNIPAKPTVNTALVSDIDQISATCGGNVIYDGGETVTARGVCWNSNGSPTINDSKTTNGTGTGSYISNISGLSANAPYYVRAYATNSVGTSYGNEVNFTTFQGFTCGTSIAINHLAGSVAPVNKTVTYGTVTNIAGEPSKCWITSNLGADRQATAVNDATEASSGWYWQFNHKQGYKHDGTTRTPNTDWITSIDEDFEWQSANDPCAIELGDGWRIPSSDELNNIVVSGNWTDWNGPWNSGLRLHAAGYLYGSSGDVGDRGLYGRYWSNKQLSTPRAFFLYFSNISIGNFENAKEDPYPVRCIKSLPDPLLPKVTTSSVSNISPTTAKSGGNVLSNGGSGVIAKGVCWSVSANPTTNDAHTFDGSGTGIFISEVSGLTQNTPYHLRAYATNTIGTSYGEEVIFTTLAPVISCGTLTINHIAGNIAPVSKTVTYETVISIPGETSKCWITSNLGADREATNVDDGSEASAGWYWQFNLKQGYKHDGKTRTPNSAWISDINENSDWMAANDPCTLELGSAWRIPTFTEWFTVDAVGNWTNWYDSWASGLKLHAAGCLSYGNGSLTYRGDYDYGSGGHYWSSSQGQDGTSGRSIVIGYYLSFLPGYSKSHGFSLRCVRDF